MPTGFSRGQASASAAYARIRAAIAPTQPPEAVTR